jgi:UDP-N-acetylmuramoyl-L-alanyl-D-glutamate--2,6-diaminopimelate ligase
MPGRGALQRFLKRAAGLGCEYAVVEVTSQGIAQHRHEFIDWDVAVFLNLAPEHIESHGSFENYRAAKMTFFSSLKNSSKERRLFFVNDGDANRDWFISAAEKVPGSEIMRFGAHAPLKNPWFSAGFNRLNAGAASAVAGALGIPPEVSARAFEGFGGVPGRLDFIQKKPFAVIVDYAHTPDSLEAVYKSVRPEELSGGKGRLICVLGSAGGGRDKWKRPAMGRVAATYCDSIILTDEDPYNEDPGAILGDIRYGIEETDNPRVKPKDVFEILDRCKALRKAVGLARPGDTVIATGKGSETTIHVGRRKKIPWNEKVILEEILRSTNKPTNQP